VDALFTDYRILSHSSNEITLNLPTEALSTALRSASVEHTGANEVVMKLAKKNNLPVLSFEIFGTTQMGRRVKVAHDVRIEVMKPTDVAMLTEPRCPEPDVRFNKRLSKEKSRLCRPQLYILQVQIMLPPLAKMRAVVERMRNLSDVIAVRANSSGRLQLSASTEVVKADITWTNCSHPRIGKSSATLRLCIRFTVHAHTFLFSPAADGASQANGGDEDEEQGRERPDPNKLFSVLVHTRSFLKFLNAHTVSKTTIACTKGAFLLPIPQ
jgi:HUS1 checkpoint protein